MHSMISAFSVEFFVGLCYRISAYVVMNLGEDAALVAFMFC